MTLKEDYEKIKKQHKLPNYDDLDHEFELLYISGLEEIKFPLRFIRRRITDKLSWFCNMLQNIIQPNPGSLISLEESKFFTDDDRKKIIDLLKELMNWERQSLILEINFSDKEDAEFINNTFNQFNKIKKEIAYFSEVLKKGWTEETKKINKEQYFG